MDLLKHACGDSVERRAVEVAAQALTLATLQVALEEFYAGENERLPIAKSGTPTNVPDPARFLLAAD